MRLPLVPFVVGLLAAVVAYGRWRPAPRSALRPAVPRVAEFFS
jgi:hypothetical protein